MKNPRLPARAISARVFPVLTASVLTVVAPNLSAATFTWLDTNSGTLNWSVGAWNPTAPTALDSLVTTDLIFNGSGTTQYTANNNLVSPFLLNTLLLNSSATVTETIGFGGLSLNANDTPAAITQSGSGAFTISSDVTAASPLALNGTGTGLLSLTGAIGGTGLLTKSNSGTVLFSSFASTYSGGTTITGGVLEVTTGVPNGNVDLPATGGSVLGNGGVVTINGGELKVTPNGTGSILSTAAARNITFGANGGTLNLNGRIAANTAATFALTLTPGGATPVIKFNGGPNGISTNNPADGNWALGGTNSLRVATLTGAAANTPLIFEVTNGAMMDMVASFNTFPGALTLRGVSLGAGGDATGQGIEKSMGRFVWTTGTGTPATYTFNSGLFFEDAVQMASANAIRRIDANITARGTASGHAAQVDISGRATGTAIVAPQAFPFIIGSGTNNGRTINIENGGSVLFDNRNRTDQANQNGVQITALSNIAGGGTLKVVQSWTGTGGLAANRPVGYIEFFGDIRGNGTAASESVLEIQLPFRNGFSGISNTGGVTFSAAGEGGTDLIVNGSNAGEGGGLRIAATPRNTRGYTANNGASAGLAFADTGADNLAKLNGDAIESIAGDARLAALTGSGGYLTIAPTDATFPFPAGGEWANAVTVGLKVTDHNSTGEDVSLSTGFVHNINITSNATLNAGGNTLGPAVVTAGLGLIKGTGSITGGVTIAAGATLAPGFSIGTLTVGDIRIDGTFQYEATNAPASDLLVVGGNLTLGGTSTLSLPGGNTYAAADYTLMTYTGTLAGTFGTMPALPANFTLDYGTGTNSTIKLLFTTTTDVWDGTLNGNWNTTDANWKTLAAFANLHKVLIDDTAAGPNTDIVINGGNVSPFSVTVNNGGVYPNYSITGSAGNAIIGTGSLTKNGTGTLTLSGPHTYSGGTNVNNGTLRLGASNSLPDVGAVTVAASGVLDMNGMTDSIGTLSVDGNVLAGNLTTTGAVTLGDGASVAANLTLGGNVTKNGTVGATISGNINLNGARTFTIASGTAPELALNGVVSNGALTKSGDGTLLLNNAGNNYAGATIVSGGILKVGVAGALPAGTALTMNAGTLDGNDTAISLSSLTGVAGTTLSLGSGSLAVAQAGNTTFAGDITGSASVTKTLGGRLTLSGTASDYSGGLFVNGGAVIATSFNAPGSGTVTVNPGGTFQAGAGLGNAIVLQGGTLATTLPNTTQLTFGDLTAATGTTSTIRLSDSVNFATVGDAIIGGTLLGSGNLAVVSNQAGADGGSGFRLRGTGTSDYSGTITVGNAVKFELQSGTTGDFSPMGTGRVVLTAGTTATPGSLQGTYSQINTRPNATGTVTFGNNVEITGAGAVNINALGAGGTTAVMGDLKIGAGQSIFFNKNDAATDRTVAFQTVTLTGGTPTFSVYDRNFRDNANAFVGPNVELGAIGESTPGSGVIFKSQGGDTAVAPFPHVTITGTASYTGTTTVAVGTLQVGAGGTSGTLGSGDVIDNGLLLFNRSDTLVVPNDISGTGAVTNAGDPANVLDLNGAQDYATLNADSGTTHLHGSFTAGTATVNVL
ncbi:MAG TPA: autotransporter-associated beta strand repeat-containing protein, partial [Chthoniobacteraceae bacterium]|nr:autotransporter-associated beta strand repeat-containing protein [Chthoniobacteraceae bacterium]